MNLLSKFKKKPKIKNTVKVHKNLDTLLAKGYNTTVKEIRKGKIELVEVKNGKRAWKWWSYKRLADYTESKGYHGFTELNKGKRTGKIHIWISKTNPPKLEDVVYLVAHEVGHNTGKQKRNTLKEEERADEFAKVAKLAYKLAKKVEL